MEHKQQNRSRDALKIPGPPVSFPERVRRELDLEILARSNAKREVRARMAIGLPPVRRLAQEQRP